MEKVINTHTVSALKKFFGKVNDILLENSGVKLKNEVYCFQIIIETQTNISDIEVKINSEISDLVKLYKVKDMPSDFEHDKNIDNYIFKSENHKYPDLLENFSTLEISANEFNTLFVVIEKGEVFGLKNINIVFSKDNKVLSENNYSINILDRCLPEIEMPITHWMHYDCIAELHNVEIFSDDFYNIFEKYLKAYVEMGNQMLLIPLITPALDTAIGGERMTAQLINIEFDGENYKFNFDKVDKFIDYIIKRGIRFFELAHLFTQWGAEFCPKIIAKVSGEYKKIFGWETASDSTEYKRFLSQYLPALVVYFNEKGLTNKTFVHLSDEPNARNIEKYSDLYKFVKPLIGNMKTMDALSDFEFYEKGVVDIPVVITQNALTFVSNEIEYFAYYCCYPTANYESNRMFVMPAERTRVIGIQLYNNKAKGFLHWGYNFYHSQYSLSIIDPYNNTSAGGKFSSGDSFLVYPNIAGKDINKSLRYYYMLLGFQDYKALMLLESIKGSEVCKSILEKYGVRGYRAYPQSPYIFQMFRKEIYEYFI